MTSTEEKTSEAEVSQPTTMSPDQEEAYNPLLENIVKVFNMDQTDGPFFEELNKVLDEFGVLDMPDLVSNLKVIGALWKGALRDHIIAGIEDYEDVLDEETRKKMNLDNLLKIFDVMFSPTEKRKDTKRKRNEDE